MWVRTVIASIAIAIVVGVLMGYGFRFFTADSKVRLGRDISLGILGSLIGWVFGMLIPIREPYRLIGADCLAILICGYALHTYWAVFKERTNLMKNFDADSPDQYVGDQAHPEKT